MNIMNSSITSLNGIIFNPIEHFQSGFDTQVSNSMSGSLYLTQQHEQPVLLQINEQSISIKKSGQFSNISLQFSVKFEAILQNEANIKSRKIGFRILKQNSSQKYQFFSKDHNKINKWIISLRSKINQIGFHKNFKAIRRLGKGQFATVFEVQHIQTGFKYAVKAFSKSHLTKTPKGMESLINEINIMRSFQHKNLQKLECVYQSDNSIYLVTQLLKGGSLFDRVNLMRQQNKKFSLQNIRQFLYGIFCGLQKLSQINVVHRDLKLDNIMLRGLNSFDPVIIDFGLATFTDQPQYLYYRCGTPGYVSPQVMGCSKTKKVECISDIFSVGAIFHHLLTEKPLFDGYTPDQVLNKNKNFIINLEEQYHQQADKQSMCLLTKMLQVNPKKRISANESIVHDFFIQNLKQVSSPTLTQCKFERGQVRQLQ